jgi:tRNA A-37 threonylcarbamoyl transferase component Bud32
LRYIRFVDIDGIVEEEFEDTKGVIKIRKSKKKRQHNGHEKVQKDRTNNDIHNIHITLESVS